MRRNRATVDEGGPPAVGPDTVKTPKPKLVGLKKIGAILNKPRVAYANRMNKRKSGGY